MGEAGIRAGLMQLAEKMSRIGTESAYEVLARARELEKQGKKIVHLEIGEPDFPTPAHVIEAGKRAMDEGWTKYGPTPGFPEFREAIAGYVESLVKHGEPVLRAFQIRGEDITEVPVEVG